MDASRCRSAEVVQSHARRFTLYAPDLTCPNARGSSRPPGMASEANLARCHLGSRNALGQEQAQRQPAGRRHISRQCPRGWKTAAHHFGRRTTILCIRTIDDDVVCAPIASPEVDVDAGRCVYRDLTWHPGPPTVLILDTQRGDAYNSA